MEMNKQKQQQKEAEIEHSISPPFERQSGKKAKFMTPTMSMSFKSQTESKQYSGGQISHSATKLAPMFTNQENLFKK